MEVIGVSEQPQGRTGELCKSAGTYASPSGHKQYVAEGDPFPSCPLTGTETRWERVT